MESSEAEPLPAKARRRRHPARAVFAGFGVTALLGWGLLSLPFAKAGPGAASWIESLFTAVSAVCVTGLVIVDTPTYWSPFGQVVILLLIQVGGLGVMTFASFVGILVTRRMSLQSRLTTSSEAKAGGLGNLRELVGSLLKISLTIEAVGAVILTAQFAITHGEPLGRAVWLGVFHSVSAFNNAGFGLFSDSMISYVGDPVIIPTLSLLTILGGLGFPVLIQILKYGRIPRLWSMNTRLVLVMTAVLLVGGTLYITILEWSNPATLGNLSVGERLLAGFFQSVQTRTAGFNSVDIGGMSDATLFGMNALMFIGGGPAGTAGGIKVTTFGVLLFILLAEIRGDGVVNVFGKRLSRAVHRQAISVVLLSFAAVVVATIAIMLISGIRLSLVLFEAVSAFATVGLSTGITADIPIPGQLILVLLMFAGRLGPITFATALALRERGLLYQLPKERPIIG